jgi:SAM-dependent methyltransferase
VTDAARLLELSEQWHDDLASWAIPPHILDQAEEAPWSHPVAMFTVSADITDSPSHRMARAAVPATGSVLDVGAGGGRAAFAVTPPAGTVVAVDHQQAMLDEFADGAVRRGVVHHEYLGDWPDVADDVPECDVVVCHHVAYNVADIVPFLQALNDHARSRVVIELPMHHPMSTLAPLWKRFWGIDRPTRPTAEDLHGICLAMGFDARLERWEDPEFGRRSPLSKADEVRFTRIRLCLPKERADEVAEVLAQASPAGPRELATIWWDRH